MRPEQARKVNLSAMFLHSYFVADGGSLVPTEAEFVDLADGNLLLADSVTGALAQLTGQTFDQVLDNVPERDERFPDDESATPMWATTIDMLKFVHASDWQQKPDISTAYDFPTAFRSSFNLAVATTFVFAEKTRQSPIAAAKMFADLAEREM